ncbi:MAG: hypothetical protein DLM59_20940 [Pseudonocardiales bacterium]|nr:MAG: hypothetical protein DLM59_20940 [Pseudonocardiales bacterium]
MIRLSVVGSSSGGPTTLRVAGEIDVTTAQALRVAITGAAAVPGSELAVDMSGVTFIDCAGVDALVRAGDQLDRLCIQLQIVSPTLCVERILFLCELGHHFLFVYPVGRAVLALPAEIRDLRSSLPTQRDG